MRCCEITCYGNKMHRKYNKMHAGGVRTVIRGVQNSKRKMVREKGCDGPYRNEMGRGSMMGRFCGLNRFGEYI